MLQWPFVQSSLWGWSVLITGFILMVWAMLSIMYFGRGLPLNAFPPEKYVTQGPYCFLKHPIYVGFGLILIGVFVIIGSPGGLWLITPIVMLSMIALVWGHENIQLRKRFAESAQPVFFSLPSDTEDKPKWNHRLNAVFVPLCFWVIVNAVILVFFNHVTNESKGNVNQVDLQTISYLNFLILLLIAGVAFLPLKKKELRDFAISGLGISALVMYVALIWPEYTVLYYFKSEVIASVVTGRVLPLTNLWVFHGAWMLLIGRAYSKALPRWHLFTYLISIILVVIMALLTNHPYLSTFNYIVVFVIVIKRQLVWEWLRKTAETIANSWKEWVFGSVRIINHGIYVGFAAFLGVVFSGLLVGVRYAWAIVIFGLVVIVFSALWAQFIEGSEKLKRPFGYYGALVGIVFATFSVYLTGYDIWVIIGVISVFMPWVQAIGRLRCLINGCCHGSKNEVKGLGIKYFHPRSRVCGLSHLKGESLHPTPLYAIIWLFFIGFILLSLWWNNTSYALIFGLYLILTGIGRFVEEAYRGEVQTPILYSLRLYQWTAILSIVIGVIMTLLPVKSLYVQPVWGWDIVWAACVLGFFTFFAMGVDFPKSNKRFSRLV
ncbi:prolipoprotein diacylglyceryl transferase family protein [Carboxylicivirga marina]|uniref:Prolipoprotein diacylglyceryl transferase n=1 Tax=Carboxylicivirga marina TaxID=2800988 RepID=A0ABS1HEQ9_9BACT|nr:prolipoprotein diacylglyceryl transferase family protein [Carboxylicivirga marina]MBK3516116.1 prolipoprotein diacylglyceryl transferase [Carboxylicivirga marina]